VGCPASKGREDKRGGKQVSSEKKHTYQMPWSYGEFGDI